MKNVTVQPSIPVSAAPRAEAKRQSGETNFKDMLSDAIKSAPKNQDAKPDAAAVQKEPDNAKATETTERPETAVKKEPEGQVKDAKPAEETDKTLSRPKTEVNGETDEEALSQAAGMQAAGFFQNFTPQTAQVVEENAEIQETVQAEIQTARPAETAAKTMTEATSAQAQQTAQSLGEGQAQTKFDLMIAKASQELGHGKTVQAASVVQVEMIEVPQETVEVDLDLDVEAPVSGSDIQMVEPETKLETSEATESDTLTEIGKSPQQEIEAEAPEQTQADKTPVRTQVLKNEDAERTGQKPARPIKETEDATLNIIQPKTPEVLYSEPIRQTPEQATPVRMPDQTEQIRTQLIKNLENDKMEFRMQLQPEELGKIDVRMVLEGGKLAVQITAASNRSTELLTRHTENLMFSLKMNNIEVSSVSVVTANENISAGMDSQYNLNNFQNQQGQQQENTRTGNGDLSATGTADTDNTAPEDGELQRMLNYSV